MSNTSPPDSGGRVFDIEDDNDDDGCDIDDIL